MSTASPDGVAGAIAVLPKESLLSDESNIPSLVRVGSMLQSIYDSIDESLDAAGCARAAGIYTNAIDTVGQAVNGEIVTEMSRMFAPLEDAPSASVLRVVYAQLGSWLGAVVSSEMSRVTASAMGLFAALDAKNTELAEITTTAKEVRHIGYL